MIVLYPAVAFGMLCFFLPESRKRHKPLIASRLRSSVMAPLLLTLCFLIRLGTSWNLMGPVADTFIGSIITFVWFQMYLRSMVNTNKSENDC
ncbi:hypothetical protein RG963_01230 [Methanosarcina sp. Z-7115]|uniref:Uncharacterized protein n=1 Tax=Methanosarcina baikalica TaxID=3073890 RepID=A0ABU2CXH6_9EURY|nr:hypothetical protein [Methanosarcina sp. Z-7115]MDR7664427.1 hypothetical protein [Methanosarcina sp. Z-7115]